MNFIENHIYCSEVLGVKQYLCPEQIYSFRSIEGKLPCKMLCVVFIPLSLKQKELLKKIMASLEVFEFSVLEIKQKENLRNLCLSEDHLAQFVCFFGGEKFLKKELSNQAKPLGSDSFLQICSLEHLEGNSLEVRKRKKEVWDKLKIWKASF